ncbi:MULTISPECIES: DUF4288 domain-containing protein [unclassified Streptomyces]|uniref:DUF4288 domain-containing protein n=1 Tax=unclassified Streptomyces TaxID=2593676 RepID=UPI00224E058D|nr:MULTISPECIES: DUF4288 domain-containing protein [unclassified Streptomyces]MCX4632262.1 DUF4288 domain-containing protein [Streptomyces sp. NBC_01443]WSW48070.1 DUF4288 domain-containing protein [Streptomyces sp. NBC_01001]
MISTDPASGHSWFSCRIRFAHMASGSNVLLYSVSVFLIQADDYATGLQMALARGRREEKVYANAEGETARIAMVEVEALDMLDVIDDGVEVACLWSEDIVPNPFPMDFVFQPTASKPTNSV